MLPFSIAGPEAVAAVEALCRSAVGRGGQRVQPRGLTNPGNLCFMNATLQVAVLLHHKLPLTPDTAGLHAIQVHCWKSLTQISLRVMAMSSRQLDGSLSTRRVSKAAKEGPTAANPAWLWRQRNVLP